MKLSPPTFIYTAAWLALLLHLFSIAPEAYGALNNGSYASASILSTGRWVRIKVKNSGIHQITDRELREMGFDNPAKVAVYGYPATVLAENRLTDALPDDVPPLPSARFGDKLVFYGEGDVSLSVSSISARNAVECVDVRRNYFADYGIYFLTDSYPRAEIVTIPYEASDLPHLSSAEGMAHFEEEVWNPGTVGARYLGPDFLASGGGAFDVYMPGFTGGKVNARILAGVRLDSSNRLYVSMFGTPRKSEIIYARPAETYSYGNEEFVYSLDGVEKRPDDLYPVKCEFAGSPTGMAALEYITALYPRRNALEGLSQSVFLYPGKERCREVVEFADEGKTLVAWDVTRRESPVALETVKTGNGFMSFSLDAGNSVGAEESASRRYVAVFDPSVGLLPVEYAGEAECANLHASEAPHMLIVASSDFMEYAMRLAELHREAEGTDVVVVSQEGIYNEFSSGTPHLMGLRRAARMFFDRNPEKFRSICLFGPAYYDSRGLLMEDAAGFRNRYLPMFVCEDFSVSGHLNRSYATDAFAGMLEEDAAEFDIEGKRMDVAVGRIPVSSAIEAEEFLAKTRRFVTDPPSGDFINRAALICDYGNENGHMEDADELARLISGVRPSATVVKAYNTIYPVQDRSAGLLRKRLVSAMSEGLCFLGYSGHGSQGMFGAEELWSVGLTRRTNYEVPPFAMFASCLSLYIDHPGQGIGTAMLFKNRGGAIGVVGSIREVYKTENQVFNLKAGDAFFNGEGNGSMGDVFRRAYNAVMEEAAQMSDAASAKRLRQNTLCYNLAGDPEIRLQVPRDRVVLTCVGEVLPGEDSPVTVAAETFCRVEGCVLSASGSVDSCFDGYCLVSVYDGRKEMHVVNGTAEEKTGMTELDEDLVYQKKMRVAGGRFEGEMYLPLPQRTDGMHRMSMYAVSDDGSRCGVGCFMNLCIAPGDAAGNVPEDAVPEISSMYLDNDGFRDGDVVGSSPVVYAKVAPNPVGVAGHSTLIGNSMTLSLDGGRHSYGDAGLFFRPDESGGGLLEYHPAPMADGRHTLTLKVRNYGGQSASRTVSFTVVNNTAEASLWVDERPAAEVATLHVVHNFPQEPSGRLVIKNVAGRTVFTDRVATFPYRWDLTGNDGCQVPEGVYEATAYLHASGRYCGAQPAEIVVARPLSEIEH